MYQCGERVFYGSHGVCQIVDIETRKIDRKMIEYYVLEPVEQIGARFYIPTQNQAALSKLRPILTQGELEALLTADETSKDAWIEDENQRKQLYRELISCGDCAALIRMVHNLYKHKFAQEQAGRKFHLCDENFLRDAQKLLESECSLVLDLPREKVGQYIKEMLEK